MSLTPALPDHPARILVVEDEPYNRQLLEVMLTSQGHRVLVAAGGDEALAMVAHEAPDLVLVDILMPGMDGFQVTSAIKGNPATKNIPVIMVTALDDRKARMHGLSVGAEDFVTKPVDHAELCVRVRNLLRLKAYGDFHDQYSRILEVEVISRSADLVASERLYRSTFDAAPVGIVHIGLDGKWLRVNQRLSDMLGYPCADLLGHAIQELMPSNDPTDEARSLRQLADGAVDRHVVDERQYARRDGSTVWARINTSVYRDAESRPQYFISVIEDITQCRALEAQLRQTSKMDAVGRLASGIAHDFNNLLTVILGFAGLATIDASPDSQHGRDLGEIITAAERAAGLTRQLLAFSRQQVLHAAPLDVNELITGMTGMLGRLIGENIEVTLDLAPRLSLALADRGQMEQVVMNLVVNARDAMPGGGRVTIQTSDVTLESAALGPHAITPGTYVKLAIADTGSGMTTETQRRLFEPFFTTKETGQGTGLGLSTTYGIVKQSNGYIWANSEPGRGTTFEVYLPRSSAVRVQARSVVATASGESASETVLLVEDEAVVRTLAARILSKAGYRVLEAANGDEAERAFAQHADSIALVVTDVIMPGCGGPELVNRLRVHAPALRALYMSGYTEPSAMERRGDHGLPFVQKPFTPAELVRQVRLALDGKPSMPPTTTLPTGQVATTAT